MTQISNTWITIANERNGVDVQRKFGGLHTEIDPDNNVEFCYVKYWEREMYPNGQVIKIEKKYYKLEDLAYTEVEENGSTYEMQARAVLTGFIQSLGNSYIIGPARQTLADMNVFDENVPNGYPLHRDTREKTLKE